MIEVKNKSTIATESAYDEAGIFKTFILIKNRVIEKTVDGAKKKYLIGEASNSKIDKDDERVAPEFLKKMSGYLTGLNVFIEHEHHIEKTVGIISNVEFIEKTATNEESLMVETELENEEDNIAVKSLLKKIENKIKIFYSIGGRITKAAKTFSDEAGRYIKELLDGEVYEVSLTALPAGNVSFLTPMTKSLNTFVNKYINEDEEFTEKLSKTLIEMMQSSELNSKLYNLYYSFGDAIYSITMNDELSPSEKADKINNLGMEYANEVQTISTEIASLVETINEQLN